MGKRAYVNPVPGFGEKEQRAFIEKRIGPMDEWYVESRGVTRDDFIRHLRAGDEAVVARVGCLAQATLKGMDRRMADMLEARGDIHARGALLVSAEGLRSNKQWPQMKEAARAFFRWVKNRRNASARKLNYTDAELEFMAGVMANKNYKNDQERFAAIRRKGIKLPGRSWLYGTLPVELSRRGISI